MLNITFLNNNFAMCFSLVDERTKSFVTLLLGIVELQMSSFQNYEWVHISL